MVPVQLFTPKTVIPWNDNQICQHKKYQPPRDNLVSRHYIPLSLNLCTIVAASFSK